MEPRRALLQTAIQLQNQRCVNETTGRADKSGGPVGNMKKECVRVESVVRLVKLGSINVVAAMQKKSSTPA